MLHIYCVCSAGERTYLKIKWYFKVANVYRDCGEKMLVGLMPVLHYIAALGLKRKKLLNHNKGARHTSTSQSKAVISKDHLTPCRKRNSSVPPNGKYIFFYHCNT